MRLIPAALLLILLAACAGERWTYIAPEGVSEATLKADHQACIEESGVVRLSEEQETLEQRCMMDHGYTMRPAS